LRDRPAGEMLREVLKLANPDGKLVYVIRRREGGPEAIFVTTRAAAAKRGEKPGEFAPSAVEKRAEYRGNVRPRHYSRRGSLGEAHARKGRRGTIHHSVHDLPGAAQGQRRVGDRRHPGLPQVP